MEAASRRLSIRHAGERGPAGGSGRRAESGQGFSVFTCPSRRPCSQLPSATLGRLSEEHAGRASAASPPPRSQQLPTRMPFADPAAPVTLAAELRSGNLALVSALPPLRCDLDQSFDLLGSGFPMTFPSPPLTLAKLFHKKELGVL